MPAIIALILRQIIMSVATGAVVTGAQELLDGTAKELVKEIQDKEGTTEQTAKDIVGNIFVDLAVNSASVFTVLKLGVGVKAAEFLGLTSKGLVKKTLTGAAAATATKLAGDGGKVVATSLFTKVAKIAAVPASGIWLASALANMIEPGIYKPVQTNALYKKLGIPFQYPITEGVLQPGSFTSQSFKDYAKGLEAAGIVGILDPFKLQTVPYDRENLADIINFIYGEQVLNGNALSANKLIPLLAPYLIGGTSKNVSEATPVKTSTTVSVAPITKVFTGIVSQGVVGEGLVFTSRPDDMIESAEELRSAAANNLAPFLNTLLGKIVYEVKVVSSVISKDGFKQTGTTQRIQTGTYQNGTAKYKTVTNKFATLVVYALTDKGSRAKLTTIVLGPTDSAKLTIGQNDLQALQNALPALVTTTDIKDITGISTTAPVAVSNPQQATPTPVSTPASAPVASGTWYVIYTIDGATTQSGPYESSAKAWQDASVRSTAYVQAGKNLSNYNVQQGNPGKPAAPQIGGASAPATTPVVTPASSTSAKAGANASTLYEWYQAQGQALPSVAARAQIYAGFGLGQASYYTGTSEQNTKLLAALKGSPNASPSSASSNSNNIVDNMYLQV